MTMSEPRYLSYSSQDSPSCHPHRYSSSLEHFEVLVRSILLRQDHPAVLILGHFSQQAQQEHGFAGPDQWHNAVAQFYDIPHIRCVSCFVLKRRGGNWSLISFSLCFVPVRSQFCTPPSWRIRRPSVDTLLTPCWPTQRATTSWRTS